MRGALQCSTNNLEDGLPHHDESDRGGIQRSTNREDGEKESEKGKWTNHQVDGEIKRLGPVPFNRPGETRRCNE